MRLVQVSRKGLVFTLYANSLSGRVSLKLNTIGVTVTYQLGPGMMAKILLIASLVAGLLAALVIGDGQNLARILDVLLRTLTGSIGK